MDYSRDPNPVRHLLRRAARHVTTGIKAAQARGWNVALVLTPAAHRWSVEEAGGEAELDAWRDLTGPPVRHTYKLPSQSDVLPDPDALLVAPPPR
ncbi:hypothetical protein ACGFYF_41140 [Streptomyces lavendulae]|uniref:hypothetical protein n=1 Tax=Streptomyces lavendulae TaxID=1914 RepID=UPI00371731CA